MATETLVIETRLPFTREMFEQGRRFAHRAREPLALTACFWLFHDESTSWRLWIATADLRETGARPVYLQAGRVFLEMEADTPFDPFYQLSQSDIYALDDREQVVGTLRALAERRDHRTDLRFTRTAARGQYIEDAFVYFI